MRDTKNLPATIGVTEVAALVDNIIQCYSQARITAEIQETEREKIRQQARVAIAQYENNTKIVIEEIKTSKDLKIAAINAIRDILLKDNVNEETIKGCKLLLEEIKNY